MTEINEIYVPQTVAQIVVDLREDGRVGILNVSKSAIEWLERHSLQGIVENDGNRFGLTIEAKNDGQAIEVQNVSGEEAGL